MESLERKDTSAGTDEPVKSEGPVVPSPATSDRSNGGVSPPPHCSICLGKLVNTSFTDSCLHQFCFTCLLQWAKIKTECPLCKQTFKSIIHNVRSEGDYDQYHVPYTSQVATGALDVTATIDIDRSWDIPPMLSNAPFMYRTTQYGRRYGLLLNAEAVARREQIPSIAPTLPSEEIRRRVDQLEFRRRIYRTGLWASPLPDGFGRFRRCNPLFYRIHPEEIDRLIPWLNRDLQAVVDQHVIYVLNKITNALTNISINSIGFRVLLQPDLGLYTEHFQHEFYNFARSNFDMVGYDRAVIYVPHQITTGLSNELVTSDISSDSSSSSSSSSDSEVRVIDHVSDVRRSLHLPNLFIGGPGPSYLPAFRNIEPDVVTVSSASSESEGECEVVGIVKPRHERTPEIIDLSSEGEGVIADSPSTSKQINQSELVLPIAEDLNLPSTSTAGGYLNINCNRRARRYAEDSSKLLFDYINSSSASNIDEADSDYNPSTKRKSRRGHKSSSKKLSKSSRKLRSRTKSTGSSRSLRKKQSNKNSSTRNRSSSYSNEEENDPNSMRDENLARGRKRFMALSSNSDTDLEHSSKKIKRSKKTKNTSPTRDVSPARGTKRFPILSDSESDYEKSSKKVKKSKKSKTSRESKRRCVLIPTSKIPKARIYKLDKLSSSDDDCSSRDSSSCSDCDSKAESKNKSRKRIKKKPSSIRNRSYRNLFEDRNSKEDHDKPSCSKSIGTIKKTTCQRKKNFLVDYDSSDDGRSPRHSSSESEHNDNNLSNNDCSSDDGSYSNNYSDEDNCMPSSSKASKSNKSVKTRNEPTTTYDSDERSTEQKPSSSKCDSPSKHSESSSSLTTIHDIWRLHYNKFKESKTWRRSHS